MNIPVYTMDLESFACQGFTLECDNKHPLLLLHEGELVTHLCPALASNQSIQNECSRHLAIKHGWDGCLWSRYERKTN